MNPKKDYDNNSISMLKGADRVRKKPAVIFGSDGLSGCEHAVFEILSNAIDEAREGFGSVIEVTRYRDKSIRVTDYGRGIPLDYNEKEQRYNWELVFCELYAGGKYNNNENSNSSYEFSLGLNGLGACATQYAAEYMDVTAHAAGNEFTLHFEKGENIGGLKKEEKNYKRTGTSIHWKPDLDVFTDINIELSYYQTILRKQAVVNAGVKFVLYDETPEGMVEYTYFYENGIADYVKEVSEEKNFTDIISRETQTAGRDRSDKPEYKVKVEVAFCFNNEVTLLEYYHNSSFLEHGGSPDKATRSAFVSAIDAYLKQNNKYNKNESKVTFTDISDSLMLVINSFSTMTSYENQTKKAINNSFIQKAITDFLKQTLEIFFIENKDAAEKIATQILINKRSRESAEKARVSVKKKLTGTMDVTNRVQKFVDCRSRDREKREVYIVEGDSALGSCKQGRDAEFQAIIPVRGKILNCLKADYNKIFKNDIIMDLMRVLGCGVELKVKHNTNLSSFDLDQLRWNKVIICTDADVDGYHIRTQILAMLYRLVPTVITAGRVFIAESPLFEITAGKNTYFAYNESEKADIIAKIGEGKYSIQRSKGLGENEPEMMWLTTMNPKTRRLIQVTIQDAQAGDTMFDVLLGDNLDARKKYIEENGPQYVELVDIS